MTTLDEITLRFNPTTTPEQEALEAELDMLVEHIVGYSTIQEIRYPDTHTIYVDVVLRDPAAIPMVIDAARRT